MLPVVAGPVVLAVLVAVYYSQQKLNMPYRQ